MTSDTAPILSVVIVACNGAAQLQHCIASLDLQMRIDQCEILVVSKLPFDQETFGSATNIHWHQVPQALTVPAMRSLGIAKAKAGVVALLEDDCTVGPSWLDSILEAHQDAGPAVGGAVEPGGYSRGLDWAVYYCEYARFLAPFSGRVDALPGNNASYKIDSLGSDALREGFFEIFFNQELRELGLELVAAEGMVVINEHRRGVSDCISMPYHHGRAYAAQRFKPGQWPVRMLYALLSPVIPMLKSARTLNEIRVRQRPELPVVRALPWIVLFHCSWSVGECLGYLAGPGSSGDRWR